MASLRGLLPLLAVGIAVTACGLLVAVGHQHGDEQTEQSPSTSVVVPSQSDGPREFGLPSADMFGNRLETTSDRGGVALPQDSAQRPAAESGPLYLISPPSGMMWQRGWGGAALGFSHSDGPTRVHDGIASGFADTPQGAGLAAYDALGRTLAAPDGIWQQVIAQRYLGGGQALMDGMARSRRNNPAASKYVVVPDGFRILPGFRPDFAVVEIAVRAHDGWASSTWPMVWVGDDWKVRVPDRVDDLWASTHLSSLAGFGVWK